MTELKQFIDFFGGLGGTAVIIIVAVSVWRGWLILPRERDELAAQLKESKEREQKWEAIALRGMKIADVSVSVAQQTTAPNSSANTDPRAA